MEKPDFSQERPSLDLEKQFKDAAETLRVVFGVENLSIIELSHLRRITKDVVPRAERDNPTSDLAIINPQEEIAVRFLSELYGIDYYHLKVNTHNEEDLEGFLEYIRRTRERAHLI